MLKLWYGPATGLRLPITIWYLSHQPAQHTVRSTAYLRGQIIYRLAEMLEGRGADLADAIRTTSGVSRKKAEAEVALAVDRTVCWAGWCDKYQMVMGSRNPVAGPYHNFS
ncbi:MAG: aldehyde dehydrogenase family protein, partial [Phycisphaerales bacterium]